MRTLKLAFLALAGIAAIGAMAPDKASARPDDLSFRQSTSRTDLDSPRSDALRRAAPKPSASLQQRELVARALTLEFQVWSRISNSYDPDVYALYVARFPKGMFAPLARSRAMFLLDRRDY
ncbi:MAG: hypothetical protein AB7E66_05300, partial [Parvibaculaceae bacterium]